jgi:hypothetical protein
MRMPHTVTGRTIGHVRLLVILICALILSAASLIAESQTLPKAQALRVWISEFKSYAPSAQAPMATLPSTAGQTLDISNGPASTAPFQPDSRYVRIICEQQCGLSSSEAAPGSNSLIVMQRMTPEYFQVPAGGTTIQVVQVP